MSGIVPYSSTFNYQANSTLNPENESGGGDDKTNQIVVRSLGMNEEPSTSPKSLHVRSVSIDREQDRSSAERILQSPKRQKTETAESPKAPPTEVVLKLAGDEQVSVPLLFVLKGLIPRFKHISLLLPDLEKQIERNSPQLRLVFPLDKKQFDRIMEYMRESVKPGGTAKLTGDVNTLISDFKAGALLGYQQFETAAIIAILESVKDSLQLPEKQKTEMGDSSKDLSTDVVIELDGGVEITVPQFFVCNILKIGSSLVSGLMTDLDIELESSSQQLHIVFPFDKKQFVRVIEFMRDSVKFTVHNAKLTGDVNTLISDFKAGAFLGYQSFQEAAVLAVIESGSDNFLKFGFEVKFDELTNVIKLPLYGPSTEHTIKLRDLLIEILYLKETDLKNDVRPVVNHLYTKLYKMGVFDHDAHTLNIVISNLNLFGAKSPIDRLVFDRTLLEETVPSLAQRLKWEERSPRLQVTSFLGSFLNKCDKYLTIKELVFDWCFEYFDVKNDDELTSLLEIDQLKKLRSLLGNLSKMKQLEKLALIEGSLYDEDIAFLNQLPNLTHLKMCLWNDFPSLFTHLQKLPKFKSLDLSFPLGDFETEFFLETSTLPNLTNLKISINIDQVAYESKATLIDVAALEKMTKLKELEIETIVRDEFLSFLPAVVKSLLDLKEKRSDLEIVYNGKTVGKGSVGDFLNDIDVTLIDNSPDEPSEDSSEDSDD